VLGNAVAEVVTLQAKYAQWFAALPEPLLNSATGEALQAIVDLNLDESSPSNRRADTLPFRPVIPPPSAGRSCLRENPLEAG
jgi:hypothetical protein